MPKEKATGVVNRTRYVDPSNETSMARVRAAVVLYNQSLSTQHTLDRQKERLDLMMGQLNDNEKREYAIKTGAAPDSQRGKHERTRHYVSTERT